MTTVTTTVETETTATENPEEQATTTAASRRARSGGIQVTVDDARDTPTMELVGGNYRPDTPEAEHRTIRAPQGGSYVYVVTQVLNEAEEAIDLTCGYPVDMKLLGSEDKRYSPIEELSEIPGNPECNELVQPGFHHKMTWVFLVPPTAEPEALEFTDVTNFEKEAAPARVQVSVE